MTRNLFLSIVFILFLGLPAYIFFAGGGNILQGVDKVGIKFLASAIVEFLIVGISFFLYGWLFPPAPIRVTYGNLRMAQIGTFSGVGMFLFGALSLNVHASDFEAGFTLGELGIASATVFVGCAVLTVIFSRQYNELCRTRGAWASRRPRLTH
jgi:hypothetical protein